MCAATKFECVVSAPFGGVSAPINAQACSKAGGLQHGLRIAEVFLGSSSHNDHVNDREDTQLQEAVEESVSRGSVAQHAQVMGLKRAQVAGSDEIFCPSRNLRVGRRASKQVNTQVSDNIRARQEGNAMTRCNRT